MFLQNTKKRLPVVGLCIAVAAVVGVYTQFFYQRPMQVGSVQVDLPAGYTMQATPDGAALYKGGQVVGGVAIYSNLPAEDMAALYCPKPTPRGYTLPSWELATQYIPDASRAFYQIARSQGAIMMSSSSTDLHMSLELDNDPLDQEHAFYCVPETDTLIDVWLYLHPTSGWDRTRILSSFAYTI